MEKKEEEGEEVNFRGDTPIGAFVLLGWNGISLKTRFYVKPVRVCLSSLGVCESDC